MTQSTVIVYDICACGCGCEPDGEWHYEGGVGCRCVSLKCPCVTDAPGEPTGGEVVATREVGGH